MLLSRAEYRIVSVARALVDRPVGPVRPLLQNAHGEPGYISHDARFLIDEALAIGWVEILARAGGWRRDRAGQRLWHRHRGVEMSFSELAPRLCRWLVSASSATAPRPLGVVAETAGDRLLCYLAARLAVSVGGIDVLADPAIAGTWLVQLAYPDVLATVAPAIEPAAPPVDDPAYRLILDGLGDALERRLVEIERGKRRLADLALATALGRIQAAALGGLELVTAVDPELSRFALAAAATIADEPPVYGESIGAGSIAERSAARAAAAAFLRSFEPWRRRAEAARAVRFFEDDYDRSQEVLRLWETLGDRRHARLAALAAELESTGRVQS